MSSARSAPRSTAAAMIAATGFTYFPISFVARFPFSMVTVGLLTLVVTARGSVAFGGLAAASAGLATAAAAPLLGAAADRFGQRWVVLTAGLLNAAALLLMAATVETAPTVVIVLIGILIGASTPQVSPLSRSRLAGIITRRIPAERHARTLHAAFSYESAIDEVGFVFGPVLVGVLATTAGPQAAVVTAALLELVFVSAFALHPTSGLATHGTAPHDRAPASSLLHSGVLVLVGGAVATGLLFGATLAALTAFMGSFGQAEAAGIVYGVMSIGSAGFALGGVLFPARFTTSARWLVFGTILLAGAVAFPFMESIPVAGIVLLVIGVGIGPILVALYSLAAVRSPAGRSATVMTMLGSGLAVGSASSVAIVGALASDVSVQLAEYTPGVAALLILVVAIANWPLARYDPVRAS